MKRHRIYLSLLLTGLVLALQVALTQGSLSARVPVPACGDEAAEVCLSNAGEDSDIVCDYSGEEPCGSVRCETREWGKTYPATQPCLGSRRGGDE